MLSDATFNALKGMHTFQWAEGFREATSLYENLITKGQLRVVKKAKAFGQDFPRATRYFGCGNCRIVTEWYFRYSPKGSKAMTVKFCPGCGAEIVP